MSFQEPNQYLFKLIVGMDMENIIKRRDIIIETWGKTTWNNIIAIKQKQNSNADNVISFTLAKPSRE
jgi:hypothetical protein